MKNQSYLNGQIDMFIRISFLLIQCNDIKDVCNQMNDIRIELQKYLKKGDDKNE